MEKFHTCISKERLKGKTKISLWRRHLKLGRVSKIYHGGIEREREEQNARVGS